MSGKDAEEGRKEAQEEAYEPKDVHDDDGCGRAETWREGLQIERCDVLELHGDASKYLGRCAGIILSKATVHVNDEACEEDRKEASLQIETYK
jgi:hypothetical protein